MSKLPSEQAAQPAWLSADILHAVNDLKPSCLVSSSAEQESFFIYHLDEMAEHLSGLMQQDVIKLWFAVKANPLSSVIKVLAQQGFNFDVASSGELKQVLAQGVSPQKVLNTGPAKSKLQLQTFLKQGVRTFVVESINQLRWLNEAARELNCQPKVLLRVQLQWPDGEKNPLGGNSLTPFGLSCDEWQQIHVDEYSAVDITGLHIFQWGNMLDNEQMFSLWSQMVPPLLALAKTIGLNMRVLDLGGGLGIDYLQQGQQLSWQKIVDDLALIKAEAGVEELWLELGRYAVAEFGYYVTAIVDRKSNYGQEQLVLAGGINHLLRPAITEQPFPVALSRTSCETTQYFDLHGPLCTSLDHLGRLLLPADVSEGEPLIFGLSGAYGFTESMPFFLCHEIAAEYVFSQGKVTQVRASETADWYLR
jgi:diaminopimelate decarboxylase